MEAIITGGSPISGDALTQGRGRSRAPAQTDVERSMVLATLNGQERATFLANRAVDFDMDWLRLALEGDYFVVADNPKAVDTVLSSFAFLTRSTIRSVDEDPELGKLSGPVSYLELNAPADVANYVRRFADQLCAQFAMIRAKDPSYDDVGSREHDSYLAATRRLDRVAAHTLIAACALDLPDTVRQVLHERPEALQVSVAARVLGSALSDYVPEIDRTEFTPLYFAMQYSNRPCMELMVKLDRTGNQSMVQRSSFEDVAEAMGDTVFPACLPSSFEFALASRLASTRIAIDEVDLGARMVTILEGRGRARGFEPYLPVFTRLGIWEQDPTGYMRTAVENGHQEIVRAIRGAVDWPRFMVDYASSPIGNALRRSFEWDQANSEKKVERFESTIMELFAKALGDERGGKAFVAHVFSAGHGPDIAFDPSAVTLQPLQDVVIQGMGRVLLAMLESGLEPTRRYFDDCQTPLELVEFFGEDAEKCADLMRAFQARKQATSILDIAEVADVVDAGCGSHGARALATRP
ncbi:hypothetical protein ACSFA0_25245 [Variovorax sp. LT1P1]|uniref:hypothetical protein n=1 Tax=Variovorax sp. LT1P1 TaxID=3443730 RepID=UPI003F462812